MNRFCFHVRSKRLTSTLLFALLPSVGLASEIVLQKAPPLSIQGAPAYPENLARFHFGADVKATPHSVPIDQLQLSSASSDQNIAEAALLCDDPTVGYELPAGNSGLLVSLSNIENIEHLEFLNHGAEGDFEIELANASMPAQSPTWHAAGRGSLSQAAVVVKVGPGEAKYVRVNFHLTHPGRIAAFGVYATPALSDFTMPRPRKVSFAESSTNFALINSNLSDVHMSARGLYASSGNLEQISDMIDDQASTTYEFAPGDPAPTAVIDLGHESSLSRISASFSAQPGRIEFYVLSTLPNDSHSDGNDVRQIADAQQNAALPTSLKLSEKEIASFKAVGSVVGSNGRAAVDFPEVTGRYVLLKWRPAAAGQNAFFVAQVAVFGPATHGRNEAGRRFSDGKEGFSDGKDGKSLLDKEIPGEGPGAPAEGSAPALPPAPSFTFIPEVPPTSP